MARESKEDRLIRIHAEALQEFDDIQGAMREERMQCLQDRRFYSIAGAQWEGKLGEQFENKPKFEVNKIHLAVIRIINEYRNNRITVDFVSKDGTDDDALADVCDGLYRADERDSVAEEAYDNAFEEAIGGGFGAWRLRACYEDEDDDEDERQRVRIEPIFDADSSVFFDLNAKRQDKSDATRCFVLTAYSESAYKDEFGDDPQSWSKDITQAEFDWYTPNVVYVAEYYRVEKVKETVITFTDLMGEETKYTGEDFENDDELLAKLTATGSRETGRRTIKRKAVHKYLLSGGGVLEDCGIIAGKHIPIVPIYGKRWFVDNVERCMGHVRLAKDVQRLKNMQLSKLGEISALSSIEKPIFHPEQVLGHQTMWEQDNIKNYPFLLLNPMTDPATGQQIPAAAIGYSKPPAIPQALAALLQITEQDMLDLLGNQQEGEKIAANTSDKAVELVQAALSMQSFIYLSNFAKGVRRGGEIWLSMMKDIAVEKGRKMKTVGTNNEIGSIEIQRPVTGENGEVEYENDLSKAKFDVAVDVGPSSSSKRAASVRAFTGMAAVSQDPETKVVLESLAMMNMEGEGIQDAREFFRKRLVKMGVAKPTDEEAQAMAQAAANQQPDAQTAYLNAEAEKATAQATKAKADTVKVVAEAEQTRAKTAEILANMDINEQNQLLALVDRLREGGQQEVPTA